MLKGTGLRYKALMVMGHKVWLDLTHTHTHTPTRRYVYTPCKRLNHVCLTLKPIYLHGLRDWTFSHPKARIPRLCSDLIQPFLAYCNAQRRHNLFGILGVLGAYIVGHCQDLSVWVAAGVKSHESSILLLIVRAYLGIRTHRGWAFFVSWGHHGHTSQSCRSKKASFQERGPCFA